MRIRKNFSVFLFSLLLVFALSGCEQVTLEETETAVNSACEAFDAQAAADAIIAYCDTHDDTAEIEVSLSGKFEGLCAAGEYQNFEWMDSVVALLADYPLQEGLQKILNDNGVARAESFLEGTWVRCDGTNLDGCEMEIKVSDAAILGIITDVSNIKGDDLREAFKVSDIKWDNVSILDDTMITFDSLSKNNTGYYNYSSSSGEIDYTFCTIYVHVTAEGNADYAKGNDQIWIKKDYIELYSNVEQLNEADNQYLYMDGSGEVVEDSYAEYPDNWIIFYYYNPEVDNEEYIQDFITTARGLHISTPKQEVIDAYGIGDFKQFNIDTDLLYQSAVNTDRDLMAEQCASSVSYTGDNGVMTFYFDKEDTVSWILFETPYW